MKTLMILGLLVMGSNASAGIGVNKTLKAAAPPSISAQAKWCADGCKVGSRVEHTPGGGQHTVVTCSCKGKATVDSSQN